MRHKTWKQRKGIWGNLLSSELVKESCCALCMEFSTCFYHVSGQNRCLIQIPLLGPFPLLVHTYWYLLTAWTSLSSKSYHKLSPKLGSGFPRTFCHASLVSPPLQVNLPLLSQLLTILQNILTTAQYLPLLHCPLSFCCKGKSSSGKCASFQCLFQRLRMRNSTEPDIPTVSDNSQWLMLLRIHKSTINT